MRRYALRDDQWDRIKDFLPGRKETVGATAKDNRLFVEAVLYHYRDGIPRAAIFLNVLGTFVWFIHVIQDAAGRVRGRLFLKSLENLLAIKSMIAFKILYLTKVVRSHPEETCTHVLSCEEWKTLYIRENRSTCLPQAPPSIKQAVLWLGK